jgi:hypothetical protein
MREESTPGFELSLHTTQNTSEMQNMSSHIEANRYV